MFRNIFHKKEPLSDQTETNVAPADISVLLNGIRNTKNDPNGRRMVMQIAELKYNKSHVEPFCAALNDRDPDVRAFAATILQGPPPDKRTIEPLRAACSDLNENVQIAAFTALCIQNGIDIRGLKYNAQHDFWGGNDAAGKHIGIGTNQIRNIKPKSALESASRRRLGVWAVPLLCAALKDRRPVVRAAAAESLATIKDKRVVEPLRTLLSDPDESVRLAVVKALQKLGVPKQELDMTLSNSMKPKEKNNMNSQVEQYLRSMTDKEPPKCPNCGTLLSRDDQIGAGEGAATMANLGVKVVKIRCPKCKKVDDVTLPFGYDW